MFCKKTIEPMKGHFSFKELRSALGSVGVAGGDTLYCHVSLDALGALGRAFPDVEFLLPPFLSRLR